METVEIFDCYKGVDLVTVLQPSTLATTLREVWILPASKQPMSVEFAQKLLAHYCEIDIEHESLLEPVARCDRLVSEFASDLHPSEVRFCFKIIETNDGAVVSVVFGSKKEMCDFDPVSDEWSD